MRSVRQSRYIGTGDVPARVDRRTAAVRSPSRVDDANPRQIQSLRQPLRRGEVLGSGQATHRRYHTEVVAPFSPDPERLAAVREALPSLGAGIYLNTGSVGPIPSESAAAMAEFANWELTTGRAHVDDWPEALQRMAEARASVAAVLTTDPASVALTHSTTDGMNAIASAIDWGPGDRALTTCMEHAGAVGPLYALGARGIEVDFVDIGDGGDDDADPGGRRSRDDASNAARRGLPCGLDDRRRAPGRGARRSRPRAGRPLRGRRCAERRGDPGRLRGDAVRMRTRSRPRNGCSGPEGMGALAIRPELAVRLHPAFAGYLSFEAIDSVGTAVFQPDARRFEWGTFHRPSVVGMARSISWLSMYVGLDWVYARGAAMARRSAERLAAIPGVQVLTPIHQMATLVTFRIEGWTAASRVGRAGQPRVRDRAGRSTRSTPSASASGSSTRRRSWSGSPRPWPLLAGHTPATLPPRRTLTILGG